MLRRTCLPVLAVLVATVLTGVAPAQAFRLGVEPLPPVAANPADALTALAGPPDAPRYDEARRCTHRVAKGARLFEAWLTARGDGESWGIERCERWGPGSASLHAEGRAVDWHLDSRVPAGRAAGRALVRLLLAPDTTGEPQALARRMGLQEIIWDCSIWTAGSPEFGRYGPCFGGRDRSVRRRRVDPTVAHMDHLHLGLTRDGAAARTSFWRRP